MEVKRVPVQILPFGSKLRVKEVVVVARPVPQEEPVPPARELLDFALLAFNRTSCWRSLV